MPTGLVKSTIQASGRGPTRCLLRDRQDYRHRAQSLGQPARAGRLLPDAPAIEREGLVADPGRLPANPELDQDHVGARRDRRPASGVQRDPPRVAVLGEQPGGERAHDVEPVRGRVDEDRLIDGEPVAEPGEAVHQFRRVGGAAAHDRDLHPLTPVSVTPWTNAFWAKKNTHHDRAPWSASWRR